MLNLVDFSVGGFPLLFIGLIELIAINWVYGELKLTTTTTTHTQTHTQHTRTPPPHTPHKHTDLQCSCKNNNNKKQISILHFIFHRITIV